ncbi:MAG: glycosyltransferase family 4 protein [Alphaproteobacteria bacterium]|nr:glycosyltransferase family 4 protein [Alphaproteobacteria bacterium]
MTTIDLLSDSEIVPRAASPTRPLRILMPSYRSHPHTGGQGVYLRHISKALVDLGHSVDVISGPPYPDLDPRVTLIRLPSLDLYARPKAFLGLPAMPASCLTDRIDRHEYFAHISGAFAEPNTFGMRMVRHFQDRPLDYDVVHDNQTLCWGLLALRRKGVPVVGTIHHPITMDRRISVAAADTFGLRLLVRRWYSFLGMQIKVARALDPVIAVSRSTLRDVVQDFRLDARRLRLVYHGIDAEIFRPLPDVRRRPNRLVATASADVPLKGLVYLIEAYASLLSRYPDLELHVVGTLRDGPTAKLLAKLGLKERVQFRSGLTDEEIVRLYAEATIAVAPSVYEGFGFPAGEAMAAGLPVVATDGGSLPEVVGEAGIVVPAKSPPALTEAIASLLDDPARRATLGAQARLRMLELFRWRATAEAVVRVYLEAMAHADGRPRGA